MLLGEHPGRLAPGPGLRAGEGAEDSVERPAAATAAEGAAVRRSARRRVRPRLLAALQRPALARTPALRAGRARLAGAELGAG